MALNETQSALLIALLDLAQEDQAANVRRLAERLGVRLAVAADTLSELDELGLASAARIRLTFLGLAVAAGARSRHRQRGPLAA